MRYVRNAHYELATESLLLASKVLRVTPVGQQSSVMLCEASLSVALLLLPLLVSEHHLQSSSEALSAWQAVTDSCNHPNSSAWTFDFQGFNAVVALHGVVSFAALAHTS